MHRFLKADCLLFIAPSATTAQQVGGDELIVFVKTAERTVDGRRRYYYAAAGSQRVMIVTRNGQPLEHLNQPNAYIKALIGWEPGTSEFTLPAHANKQHTKITVDMLLTLDERAANEYARVNNLEIESLTAVLSNAPRADRPGGARGDVGRHPVGSETRAVSRSVTLLPEQWEVVEGIAKGNRSAGVRWLVEDWLRQNGDGHE